MNEKMIEPTLYHLATKEHEKAYNALLDALERIVREEAGCRARGVGYDAVIDGIAKAAIAQAEKEG